MYGDYEESEAVKELSEEDIKKKKHRRNTAFVIGIVGAVLFVAALITVICIAWPKYAEEHRLKKPVIYLYPETETRVSVKLDFDGVSAAYPEYNDGWSVTAYPDGMLVDGSGEAYGYLFWEADSDTEFDFSEGFCVKGSDTADFLRWALAEQGLTSREYNEFIVYWLPYMKDNAYNVISFQGQCYEESAPLKISPTPDTVKRVFMAYYPCDTEREIPPQELIGFERSGFTVVEWGGACVE